MNSITCSDSVRNILRPNFKFRVQQDDGEQLYEVHMDTLWAHEGDLLWWVSCSCEPYNFGNITGFRCHSGCERDYMLKKLVWLGCIAGGSLGCH